MCLNEKGNSYNNKLNKIQEILHAEDVIGILERQWSRK